MNVYPTNRAEVLITNTAKAEFETLDPRERSALTVFVSNLRETSPSDLADRALTQVVTESGTGWFLIKAPSTDLAAMVRPLTPAELRDVGEEGDRVYLVGGIRPVEAFSPGDSGPRLPRIWGKLAGVS